MTATVLGWRATVCQRCSMGFPENGSMLKVGLDTEGKRAMGGARILIVEDDPCVRELLYLHLSGAGYQVLVAEDAMVGGRFLLEQRVDLLIADINMPFMDGLDLVQAIRQEPSVSSMPVVFLTSHGEYEDRARTLGAVAFIRKPVLADELLGIVARHALGR